MISNLVKDRVDSHEIDKISNQDGSAGNAVSKMALDSMYAVSSLEVLVVTSKTVQRGTSLNLSLHVG